MLATKQALHYSIPVNPSQWHTFDGGPTYQTTPMPRLGEAHSQPTSSHWNGTAHIWVIPKCSIHIPLGDHQHIKFKSQNT